MSMNLTELRRTTGDRHIAGVAGGVAVFFGIDPRVVRILFVIAALFGGAGIVAYIGLWLFVPEEETTEEAQGKTVFAVDDGSRHIVIWAVAVLTALALLGSVTVGWAVNWISIPVIVAALIVFLIVRSSRNHEARAAAAAKAAGDAADTTVAAASEAATTTAKAVGDALADAGRTIGKESEEAAARFTGQATDRYAEYRRTHPKKPGPILFWWTLGVVLLSQLVVGMIDMTGVDMPRATYPAVALGVIGVMLVVGSFYGRPGGLILLGLLATTGLIGGVTTDRGEWGTWDCVHTVQNGDHDIDCHFTPAEGRWGDRFEDRTFHIEINGRGVNS